MSIALVEIHNFCGVLRATSFGVDGRMRGVLRTNSYCKHEKKLKKQDKPTTNLMNTGFPWTCKFIRNDAILVGAKPCALWVSILTPPSYDFT